MDEQTFVSPLTVAIKGEEMTGWEGTQINDIPHSLMFRSRNCMVAPMHVYALTRPMPRSNLPLNGSAQVVCNLSRLVNIELIFSEASEDEHPRAVNPLHASPRPPLPSILDAIA